MPCKDRDSSIWLERPGTSTDQQTEFRLKTQIKQHEEIISGKTPGLFPVLHGEPLYINGKLAPRAIPDTVAVKQPADPKKAPKVRFCRNASAIYQLGKASLLFILSLGLTPPALGFTCNQQGDWVAPSLNETVDPRDTTISFQKLLDLAAMTLLCWAFSTLDWKGAFRQISISPDDYRFTYYIVATTKMMLGGRLRDIDLIAIESRLFFGGAGATSGFSVFPIAHCRGRVLEERARFAELTPHRKSCWNWAYSIVRSKPCPTLPQGNRVQDFGLAQLEDSQLPRARPKIKDGKRIFPRRPQTSQALKWYRGFRLNHRMEAFGFYVDDVVHGHGRPNISRHKGNFDNLLTHGVTKSAISYKEAEAGEESKIVHAQRGKPVTFGGIDLYPQPNPRVGLPKDKRLQNAKLIRLVLYHHDAQRVPFRLLEMLLGKLGWWAMIDNQIWCYLAPLQWHVSTFLDLFAERPTDPRTLISPRLEPLVVETLEYLLSELEHTECTVPSITIAHLPLWDGCVCFITDAAGAQAEGIGVLFLGEILPYVKEDPVRTKGGGATHLGLYPTNFEANLRQNSKEMLGVFLGALEHAPLAAQLGLPLLVCTDNAAVLSTVQKARSGS